MLRRRLKEIQIEWDEKMRKQREHKEKSKQYWRQDQGILSVSLENLNLEETKELSKINKWLDRHNESALKEKVESNV